jgi:hypothetical protein
MKQKSAVKDRNGGPPSTEPIDIVDPLPEVAKRWKWSVDSIKRAARRGEIKITKLGPRRHGLRRSEQRRYLDERTG